MLQVKEPIKTLLSKIKRNWAKSNQTDTNGNSLRVTIKIDDVEKNEKDPHTNIGDYIVNYIDINRWCQYAI